METLVNCISGKLPASVIYLIILCYKVVLKYYLCFQVLKPLQDRFKNVICQENFNRIFHEENVKMEIIDILESFIGKYRVNSFTDLEVVNV